MTQSKRNPVWLIVIFTFFIVGYAILIPAYENPDEIIHYHRSFEENNLEITWAGDGNTYYFILHQLIEALDISESNFSSSVNSEFEYFGDDFRFLHDYFTLGSSITKVRLLNLFFIIPILFVFLKSKRNINIFGLFLAFPGVTWFFSIINPDVLSISLCLLIFKFYFQRKLIAYFLIIFGYFFMDRSIILLILAFFTSELYFMLENKKRIFKILFFLILFFLLSSLYILAQSLIDMGADELEFAPIKSIIGVLVSFYGLVGSMSIKATYIEYVLVLMLMGYTFYKTVTYKTYLDGDVIHKIKYLILFYCVFWLYLLSFAPTLDQGRYFYFILPFIFLLMYITTYSRLSRFLKLNNLILIGFITNSLMYLSIIMIYLK